MIDKDKDRYDLNDLLEIMKYLRSENGCPWDREQTHSSIKKCLIEEAYEVLEVIDLDDKKRMCEELGDLLLQVVFHAQLASENGDFDLNDIINGLCKKLIGRHTHVFGEKKAQNAEAALNNWDAMKNIEKGVESFTETLKNVPSNLPALMRSLKIQQKAAKIGFDWEHIEDAMDKVLEEIDELKEIYKSENLERISEEIGDVLFSVVNVSRFLKVHPELALTSTINKFISRFEFIEKESNDKGLKLNDMTLEQMDELWNISKRLEC